MFDGMGGSLRGILSLTNMSITHLPDRVFGNLNQLWKLFLENNPLSEVTPESFYGLSNVVNLNLGYTDVVVKPGLFKYMPRLGFLNISGTPFKFTQGMWDGVSLKYLKVEYAGISDLTHVWSGLKGTLKSLDLNGNHFPTLGPHSFQGLTKTWHFGLNDCDIEYIEAQAFEGLPEILALTLEGNPLISLDPDMFGSHVHNKYGGTNIYFDREFFPCSEQICWLYPKVQAEEIAVSFDWRETKCDNIDKTVMQFLENDC